MKTSQLPDKTATETSRRAVHRGGRGRRNVTWRPAQRLQRGKYKAADEPTLQDLTI
jgi:hypothetical protein